MTKLRWIFGTAALLLVLCLWLIAKDAVFTALTRDGPETSPAAPDPSSISGWLARPAAPPPAVWEGGWALDVFALPDGPDISHPRGSLAPTDEPVAQALARQNEPVVSRLSEVGPVYMPTLRLPSPAQAQPDWSLALQDTARGFTHYLDVDNRGRGFVLALPARAMPLLPALESVLAEATDLERDRFAGVILLSASDTEGGPIGALCSRSGVRPCPLSLDLSRPYGPLRLIVPHQPGQKPPLQAPDADRETDAAATALLQYRDRALAYLDTHATRKAEPFGGFEEIEVAPVREPGSTPGRPSVDREALDPTP